MDELMKQREELLKQARDIAAKAEADGRDFTDDERTSVEDLLAKAKDLNGKIANVRKSRQLTTELGELLKAGDADDLNQDALKGARLGLGGRPKAIGQMVTDSEQFKAFLAQYPNGIPESAKGISMPPVHIGGLKALLTGVNDTDSAGVLVEAQRLGLVPFPTTPLTMRDLVTVGTTTSDSIEYAQVLPAGQGSTSAAKGVKEATDSAGASGTKPQSELKFRKAKAPVITVPHWLAATKRALSDAAQVRTLIDNFLRQGVAREFERQMLVGDEDAPLGDEEFNGILNTTGVQDQAWAGSLPATARKMITKVQKAGGLVTAFAVSPETDEALDLLQDDQSRYYGSGPFSQGPSTLWGRPRVVVHDLPADKIVGGDFSTAVLWDREQTTISVSDSHADFFIRNLVAILAEARAAFGVLNPQLLAVGDAEPAAG